MNDYERGYKNGYNNHIIHLVKEGKTNRLPLPDRILLEENAELKARIEKAITYRKNHLPNDATWIRLGQILEGKPEES